MQTYSELLKERIIENRIFKAYCTARNSSTNLNPASKSSSQIDSPHITSRLTKISSKIKKDTASSQNFSCLELVDELSRFSIALFSSSYFIDMQPPKIPR